MIIYLPERNTIDFINTFAWNSVLLAEWLSFLISKMLGSVSVN